MNIIRGANGTKDYREANRPSHCPITGEPLSSDNAVLDHCHVTGQVRGVVSRNGNVLIGKIENAWRMMSGHADLATALAAVAAWVSPDNLKDTMHPVGFRQRYKRFGREKKAEQVKILLDLGVEESAINAATNARERTKLFKVALLNT